jgi:purine-binding chemotaxis protein CheW
MNEELQEQAQEYEDTQKDKYLTFSIGDESYGIEIMYVTEIIGIQPITTIPEMPEYIRGVINLRGKIIPVMDARLRFRKPMMDYTDRTCVIVIDMKDISIGLIVDCVSEVLSIPASDIVPPPELGAGANKFIKGIGKVGQSVKLIIDCEKLLDEEYDQISELKATCH